MCPAFMRMYVAEQLMGDSSKSAQDCPLVGLILNGFMCFCRTLSKDTAFHRV